MEATRAQIEADDEARTTSIGLFGYACEYLAVAIAANEKLGADQRPFGIALMPVNFLIGQAIELAFKAFLRESGATLKEMRALGHNLNALLAEAIKKGLSIAWNTTDTTILALLNEQYQPREFQYIKTGIKTFPQIEPLSKTAAKVVASVAGQVPNASGFFLGNRIGRTIAEISKQ
jgi:hypothetical protein